MFYRVDPGGPFTVTTPAGEVHVTGTCFRVEVLPMKPSKQGLLGAAGSVLVLLSARGRLLSLGAQLPRTVDSGAGPIDLGRPFAGRRCRSCLRLVTSARTEPPGLNPAA